ncbi:hypothetical protein [Actinoplanes sp. GCM10030250]|uniref:hypothetical protein n=1 Tax=Actinoplanes sp. GCM10030250 TaxID=3273376 RepID=UPI00361E1B32
MIAHAGLAPLGSPDVQAMPVLRPSTPEVSLQTIAERLAGKVIADRRADLLILSAEALAWQGHPDAALKASRGAADITQQSAGDLRRRTLAVGVSADVALRVGGADAADACAAFVHAVAGEQPFSWLRYVVASAMQAIAVYQRSHCQAGTRMLAGLLGKVEADTCLSTMLAAAASVMERGCTPGAVLPPLAGLVPPLPGLLLVPDLSSEATSVGPADIVEAFAGRVRLHPAAHACGLTVASASAPGRLGERNGRC